MIPRHLFLIMLDHAGGTIAGKTLTQKRAYFVGILLGTDIGFSPHYYGPFSAELDASVGSCKALGFAREDVSNLGMVDAHGFEVRRFTYSLTEDGRKVVANLEAKEGSEVDEVRAALDRIRQAGDDDYFRLSIAAKALCIIREKEGRPRPNDVVDAASEFGWVLSSQQVDDACAFLRKLGLLSLA